MAKRYGRNQRRAHRERVEALEAEMKLCRDQRSRAVVDKGKALEELHRLDVEYTNFSEELVQLLGPNTAFQRDMPQMQIKNRSNFRIELPDDKDGFTPYIAKLNPIAKREFRYAVIKTFIAEAHTNPADYVVHIRLMTTSGEGGLGYSVSEHYLEKFRESPRHMQQLVQMMSGEMVDHMTKTQKKRYG